MKLDTVHDKLRQPINKKILLLILGLPLFFQTYVNIVPKTEEIEYVISAVCIILPLIASIASFSVVKKYGTSIVFGKAYTALGAGLFMLFLGEVTWFYFDVVLKIYPFPSIADVFFFLFYPLTMTHIILNVRFFQTKIALRDKFWICAVPTVIVLIFLLLSLNESVEANFEFYYCMIFILSTSIVLALALLGALVFRGGALGTVWILLLLGIMLYNVGDVWYYYLEMHEAYADGHPVEFFWNASYCLIFYALYKHRKII